MRRSLVLSTESARHSFRVSLPPHVCAVVDDEASQTARWRDRVMTSEVRSFMMAYSTCLTAVTAFIA